MFNHNVVSDSAVLDTIQGALLCPFIEFSILLVLVVILGLAIRRMHLRLRKIESVASVRDFLKNGKKK